jgi:hypothetical protein
MGELARNSARRREENSMIAQPSTEQPKAPVVWRNGLIYGAILAAIGLVSFFINLSLGAYNYHVDPTTGQPVASAGFASTATGILIFLVNMAVLFVSGMMTARKTGSIGAASLTGLIAGAIGALVGATVTIIVVTTIVLPKLTIPSTSSVSLSQIQAIVTGVVIVAAIFGIAIDAGLGAGVAALGGLVGRNSYQQSNPPQLYQQSYYPSAYPGGAPGAYPGGAPGYGPGAYPGQPPVSQPDAPPAQQPGGYPPPPPPQQPLG